MSLGLSFNHVPSVPGCCLQLPMVLMSLPVAWLSVSGCWAYFSADWQRALSLGLYSRAHRPPAWLEGLQRYYTAAVRRHLHIIGTGARGSSKARQPAGGTALQRSAEAAPLVYHWALMTAVALLVMHVNVATRFLSACPPLYWHAAEWAAAGGWRTRLLWLWCFAYIALGCLLFPNFYPWC
jgi:phosphatidylinositol glycan class V